MNSSEGKGYFGIGLDTSELEASKVKAVSLFQDLARQAESSGAILDQSLSEAIQKVKTDFDNFDPTFGQQIQAEIDKNVSALSELKGEIEKVGDIGIQLGSNEFVAEANELYAELDNISGRLAELDEQLNSADTPKEEIKGLWNEYSKLIHQLEVKNEKLDEIESAYANSDIGKEIAENEKLYASLNQQITQVSSTIEHLENTQEEYNSAVEKAKSEQKGLADVFGEVTDSINPLESILSVLPAPLRAGVKGLQGMTGAANKFIAVPLIAVISAIVLGLKALFSWFTKTSEGQMAFIKISNAVTGVLDQLMDIVVGVGKAIYDAFTNPQEAVKKLWETIKTNIVNRIQGLGKIFQSLGKIISSGFTSGYKELGDAFVQATTGVEDLVGKSKEYLAHLKEMGDEKSRLAVKEEELNRRRRLWTIEEQKLDTKIAEARNRMRSETTDELRKQAALEMQSYVDEKYKQKVIFAKEELEIAKQQNELSSSTQQDLDRVTDLTRDLLALETQRVNELSRAESIMGSIDRKATTGQGKTPAEIQAEGLIAYSKALEDLEEKTKQAEHDFDVSGTEDRMAQIRKQYDFEVQMIQRNRQAFIDQFEGVEGVQVDTTSFDVLLSILLEKRAKEEQEHLKTMIEGFETAEQERNAIIEKYAKKRRELEKAGADQANIEKVNQKEVEELASFDTRMQDTASIVSRMFSDVVDSSLDELYKLRSEALDLLKFLTDGEWDAEKGGLFGITKEQFEDIIADPKKLESFRNGVEKLDIAIQNLETPIERIKNAFHDLFNPSNTDPQKAVKAIRTIQQSYLELSKGVGVVIGMFEGLAQLSGSSFLSDLAGGLSDVMAVTDDIMAGAEAGSAFGTAGAIAGAVMGAVKGIGSIVSRNKEARDELRKIVKENQEKEYFGQLEIEEIWRRKYEWSKKIGESTLHHIKREGEELKKQAKENEKAQADLWEKLRKEQYKSGEHFKKTGLFGWGKGKIVEEWSSLATLSWEQIEAIAAQGKLSEDGQKYYEYLVKAREEGEDLERMQLEYLEKMREIYTGTSYDSLVSGIVDAFAQGKRSAKDFADSFEKLMEGAITSSLQLLADEEVRAWYEKFAERSKDGLTDEDMEELQSDWIKLNENLAEKAKALEEATGVIIGGIDKQGAATYGAYEKVTQEQWSRTDGLLRGMHQISIEDSENIKSIAGWRDNISEMRNIAMESWSELVYINKNTKLIRETNEILDKIKRDGIKVI